MVGADNETGSKVSVSRSWRSSEPVRRQLSAYLRARKRLLRRDRDRGHDDDDDVAAASLSRLEPTTGLQRERSRFAQSGRKN